MTGDSDRRADDNLIREFTAFGLAPPPEDDAADDDLHLWPENAATVEVFIAMSTQWVRDFSGNVTGLRYEALPAVMRLCAIPRADHAPVFAGLRVMERAALDAIQESRRD